MRGKKMPVRSKSGNVIHVDFGGDNSDTRRVGKTRLRVFIIEESPTIGLRFSQDINEFHMDVPAAERLIEVLVRACMRLEGKGEI